MEAEARVQSISQSGVASVPPQYIQPISSRPHFPPPPPPPFPSINLNDPVSLHKKNLHLSCLNWGAFHVTNHGVPLPLLHQIRHVSLSFFQNYPLPQKLKYSPPPNSPASQGYGSKMLSSPSNDVVLDWRDYFNHHTFPLPRRDKSLWPDFLNYREVVGEYGDEMKKLATRLLRLMSENLGLGELGIEECVGEIYQNVTVSYYPVCPEPEMVLGLQAHSDMGAITLLVQDDVGGLEVLKDGEWVRVDPVEDAILVILADQTEVITNGKYRSAVHRAVTNASRARLSVATFHDPAKTREISPVFEPPKYRPVLYGDYVSSWYTKGPAGKRNIDALLL